MNSYVKWLAEIAQALHPINDTLGKAGYSFEIVSAENIFHALKHLIGNVSEMKSFMKQRAKRHERQTRELQSRVKELENYKAKLGDELRRVMDDREYYIERKNDLEQSYKELQQKLQKQSEEQKANDKKMADMKHEKKEYIYTICELKRQIDIQEKELDDWRADTPEDQLGRINSLETQLAEKYEEIAKLNETLQLGSGSRIWRFGATHA